MLFDHTKRVSPRTVLAPQHQLGHMVYNLLGFQIKNEQRFIFQWLRAWKDSYPTRHHYSSPRAEASHGAVLHALSADCEVGTGGHMKDAHRLHMQLICYANACGCGSILTIKKGV